MKHSVRGASRCAYIVICSRVVERHDATRCAVAVSRGLYFRGTDGYAVVHDSQDSAPASFSLSSGFTASVVFRTATLDALLLTAWKSYQCFALLGFVNGQVL